MSERVDVIQNFEPVEVSQLLTEVKDLKAEGYRFAQACATVVEDKVEIIYSFDKAHQLKKKASQAITGLHSSMKMRCMTCSVFSSITAHWTIRATSLWLQNQLHGIRRNRKGR